MIIHNKLVRDKIPEKIIAKGESCTFKKLTHADYITQLCTKLQEECDEYLLSFDTEELADILEVVYALGKCDGLSEEDINKIRKQKTETNGAFEERLFLINTKL
jgi:predicted house-cleaning noncanonical NTP pyrophosphatase (MazG superfamily)